MVGRRIKTWGMTGFGVKEGRDEAARDMDEPILLCLNLLRDLWRGGRARSAAFLRVCQPFQLVIFRSTLILEKGKLVG
jgi:hypothetical protein